MVLGRRDQQLDERVDRRRGQVRAGEDEGEAAPRARVQAALDEQPRALAARQQRPLDGLQRVPADRERLRVGQHPPVGRDQRQIVGQERVGLVVEQAQARGRLAGVRPGGDQERLAVLGQAGGVDERVAALRERPAQDRLDDVRVEHVRRPADQRRRRRLHLGAELDRHPEARAGPRDSGSRARRRPAATRPSRTRMSGSPASAPTRKRSSSGRRASDSTLTMPWMS